MKKIILSILLLGSFLQSYGMPGDDRTPPPGTPQGSDQAKDQNKKNNLFDNADYKHFTSYGRDERVKLAGGGHGSD